MVPLLLVGQLIKGLLGKDIPKFVIWLWYYVLKFQRMSILQGFGKSLRDILHGPNYLRLFTNEPDEDSVTLVNIVWVWECQAWQWFGLSGFQLCLWNLFDVHSMVV